MRFAAVHEDVTEDYEEATALVAGAGGGDGDLSYSSKHTIHSLLRGAAGSDRRDGVSLPKTRAAAKADSSAAAAISFSRRSSTEGQYV